ncbi:unnamed protein product, partial [Laminaria digitata]
LPGPSVRSIRAVRACLKGGILVLGKDRRGDGSNTSVANLDGRKGTRYRGDSTVLVGVEGGTTTKGIDPPVSRDPSLRSGETHANRR